MLRSLTVPTVVVLALGLVLVLVGNGCGWNPARKRPEVRVVSGEREAKLGDEALEQLVRLCGFIDGPPAEYVSQLGARLAAHSPRKDVEYQFYVADLGEVASFSLPGGHVVVTRGAIMLANSESELANLLAHEIGHVAGRDAVRRRTREATVRVPTEVLAGVVGELVPPTRDPVETAGRMREDWVLHDFDVDQELAADRVGQEIVAAAGLDPGAMATVLRALREAQFVWGGVTLRGDRLQDVPPVDSDRIRRVENRASQLAVAVAVASPGGRTRLLAHLDGMRVGPNPAYGRFLGPRWISARFDLSLHLPENWQRTLGRTFLRASSPDGRASLSFGLLGRGDNPLKTARAFLGLGKGLGSVQPLGNPVGLQIAGLDAARALAFHGRTRLDLTWIAHRGRVFQQLGAAHESDIARFGDDFLATALSARPLEPSEAQSFLDVRLRVEEAGEFETLAQVLERTGSLWSPADAGLVNALDPAVALGPGSRVKVAVASPWTPEEPAE